MPVLLVSGREPAVLAGDVHALAGALADQVGLELGDDREDLTARYQRRTAGLRAKACLKWLERGEVYVRRKVKTKVPCSSDVR